MAAVSHCTFMAFEMLPSGEAPHALSCMRSLVQRSTVRDPSLLHSIIPSPSVTSCFFIPWIRKELCTNLLKLKVFFPFAHRGKMRLRCLQNEIYMEKRGGHIYFNFLCIYLWRVWL